MEVEVEEEAVEEEAVDSIEEEVEDAVDDAVEAVAVEEAVETLPTPPSIGASYKTSIRIATWTLTITHGTGSPKRPVTKSPSYEPCKDNNVTSIRS